jgi:hypothetical protein
MTEQSTPEPSIDPGPSITCWPTGREFFVRDPFFDIEEIAHALGMMCRFNGHTRHFYSVAEHSVIVSLLMQELRLGDPWEGLFHDGVEAYIPDMVAGWKNECKGWKEFEGRVDEAMRDQLYMPPSKTYGCQQADRIAFYIEYYYLKSTDKITHHHDGGSDDELQRIARKLIAEGWRTMNLYPKEATAAFLKRYNELGGVRHG